MMDPKDLKNLLYRLEYLALKQPRTGGDTKFQMSIIFNDAIECIEYRIPKRPILLNKNGHEFKCPTCGTVFDSPESHVSEYDLCYVCGQLWKDYGTIMEELHGSDFLRKQIHHPCDDSQVNRQHCGKVDRKHDRKSNKKTGKKAEYGRKKKGMKK